MEFNNLHFDELKSHVQGTVICDEEGLEARSRDFGRILHRRPAIVVRPAGAADVAAVIRWAARNGVPVATRGEAHSQTGQSLSDGGVVIDMTSLDRIVRVDAHELTVTCESGITWRNLVAQLEPSGLIPPVLTNNLGVTVGGTLSVAGLGVASFHHGTQADNALELEVVTGNGEIVVCSASDNPELFNAVRSGLGQFGVITRARMRVRRFQPLVRRYFLLYDDLEKFMVDSRSVMFHNRADYIEAWCVPCPMGFRNVGGEKQTFAEWFFPLQLTVEFDPARPPTDTDHLAGLSYYRLSHIEDEPIHDFANRLEPLFALWRISGYWAATHPWMETILPWESAPDYIRNVLAVLPPASLGGGHVLLWPCRGDSSTVPLFMKPDSPFVIGFGILPGIPKERMGTARERLNMASEFSIMAGGKRYLSGLIQFDRDHWAAHFGSRWPEVNRLKRKYDPAGILNPGFIVYENPATP